MARPGASPWSLVHRRLKGQPRPARRPNLARRSEVCTEGPRAPFTVTAVLRELNPPGGPACPRLPLRARWHCTGNLNWHHDGRPRPGANWCPFQVQRAVTVTVTTLRLPVPKWDSEDVGVERFNLVRFFLQGFTKINSECHGRTERQGAPVLEDSEVMSFG